MPRGGPRPGAGAPAGNLPPTNTARPPASTPAPPKSSPQTPKHSPSPANIFSGESQRQARPIEQAKRLLDTLYAKAQERAAARAA